MSYVPSIEDIRERLLHLDMRQLRALAADCALPWQTVYKIRIGTTDDPGLRTVRRLWPHLVARGKG
jgi:hypothetical protein